MAENTHETATRRLRLRRYIKAMDWPDPVGSADQRDAMSAARDVIAVADEEQAELRAECGGYKLRAEVAERRAERAEAMAENTSQSPNFDAYLAERLTDPEVRAGYDAADSEPQNLVRHPDGTTSPARELRGAWWVRLELWLRAKRGSRNG